MKLVFLLAGAFVLAAAPALAETQLENIVAERRITVGVQAKPEAVQRMLPNGWIPNAQASGANLTIIFIDRALTLAPDGKALNAGTNRAVTLVVGARNSQTGETRSMIVGGYTADLLSVPGVYKVARAADVDLTRRETKFSKGGKLAALVEEHWSVMGSDAGSVRFDVSYVSGVPIASRYEETNYSGADPNLGLIQRTYAAAETLRSATVDQLKSIRLKAFRGQLGGAVDGSERIVTVAATPFYSRLTLRP